MENYKPERVYLCFLLDNAFGNLHISRRPTNAVSCAGSLRSFIKWQLFARMSFAGTNSEGD